MKFTRTPVALAIAALAASQFALASEPNGNDGHHHDPIDEEYQVSVDNNVDVSFEKHTSVNKSLSIEGGISVEGHIPVMSSSMAIVDDKQISTNNMVGNTHHENNASIDVNAGGGATGNIGVNLTSGDNNMQDNAAAISASDAYFVFGASDAEVFVTQVNAETQTMNSGNVNNATMGGSAFEGAGGNIGINVSAGNSNLQKNNAAMSVAPSRLSEASVANIQRSGGNLTVNEGRIDELMEVTRVSMSGEMSGGYSGSTGGSYSGSQSGSWSGSYSGTSTGSSSGTADQIGNVYPDIWTVNNEAAPHNQHPYSPSQTGHFDLDTETQGGSDLNDDGGALAFSTDSTYSGTQSGTTSGSSSGTHGGSYSGSEIGSQSLAGTFTGSVATVRYVVTPSENNAHLGGNVLADASGNIGVNIASGTGNLQNNSMAMAITRPALGFPNGNGGSPGSE